MLTSEQLDPEQVNWDAIVIGTGMGGGTLGHALARAGLRVPVCGERVIYTQSP